LTLAAHYGGAYNTSEVGSEIIRLRQGELLRSIDKDMFEKDQFQEIILDNCRALRDVINKGERSFDEFLVLLDESEKFKKWVTGVNPDKKLMTAYHDEIAAQGWLNKTPVKAMRYMVNTIAGVLEPVTGLILSTGDAFALEKMIGGWRPSHFVDQNLKPFVDPLGE
jgi:hypothetical protein